MTELETPNNTSQITTAKIVYVLYLVSIMAGLTGIIGVVMAYIYRSDAPEWLRSHFHFQIRTFWIGALLLVLAVLFAVVLFGYLIGFFWVVWLIIRSVKGIQALDRQQPITEPTRWGF